jgi:hypothetical protein
MWGLWATKLKDRASEAAETIKSSVTNTVSSFQSHGLPVLESLAARISSQSTCSSAEDITSIPSTSSASVSGSVLGCTTLEHRMEDLDLSSSSGVQESDRDQPVDLTTQPDNGVAATGPPQKHFNLVAVTNHMQWLLNRDSDRSLLGPHLVALCRDVISMAEIMSVLTADPHVLTHTLGHERILRALTLQNQLDQLLAQMEERASTLLLPAPSSSAPSMQSSFSPRQLQQDQSEDGGPMSGMDEATSLSSDAPLPLIFRPGATHSEIVSRGATALPGILSISTGAHFHRQGPQSFSSSGSAQEFDNLPEPPAFEQKFRPPPVPGLEPSGSPIIPSDRRLLETSPDLVTQALEESGALREGFSPGVPPDRPPSLLADLEEAINRLEGEQQSVNEVLNPPPDPPWRDHREEGPREPPDIDPSQRNPRWTRS